MRAAVILRSGYPTRSLVLVLFLLKGLFLLPQQLTFAGAHQPPAPPSFQELGNALDAQEKAWLQDHPLIRAGGPRAFPPFHSFDKNGNAEGIAVDYLRLVMGQIGLKVEVQKSLPWPEVMGKAREKEIDLISCAAKTPEREDFLLFSNPYLSFPLVIIGRKDGPFIGGLDDLRGKRVAFVKGNSVFQWVKNDGFDVVPYLVDSPLEALKAVSSGDVQAHIENLAAAGYLIEHYGLTNLKIAAPTPYDNYELYFAVRKDWPELASIINKVLERIPSEQHAAIRNRWLSVRYDYGISRWDVAKWIFAVALTAFFIVMLSLLSNRRLRKEILERSKAERSLRESEEKMKSIFLAAPIGIGVVVDRIITEVNTRMHELTGYTRGELMGASSRILYTTEEDYENVGREKYDQIAQRGYGRVETVWKKKDGTVINVLLSSAPIDPGNPQRGITFTALDITSLRQAEADKDRMRSRLAEVHKMEAVGRLAGGIAHDFNNILQAILGYVELALMKLEKTSPIYPMLQKIGNSGYRSADLVKQLLAFARKQTISPRILDLNETVEGMLKMLRRLLGEDIELVWKPGSDLFPVMIDPVQVNQILVNLCINAREAIEGVGKITLETARETLDAAYCSKTEGLIPGEYLMLAVSDTGCGMGEEVLRNLFEPFFTTKGVGKGSGLGLSTVYGIIRQNNGGINVYSEPGRGSTFKIHLPQAQLQPPREQKPQQDRKDLGGTETILLVEDDETILALGKSVLEDYGYTVLAAHTPTEALNLAKTHSGRIHLLVTDVVMPVMNGQDLNQRLSPSQPGMKCIFMSGYTANVIVHHGVLEEGVHFLQKPFSVNAMLEKVRTVLNSRDRNQK